MAAEELIEVKFRLPDGSDIGTSKYSSTTTVAYIKERIISQWPNGDKGQGFNPHSMQRSEVFFYHLDRTWKQPLYLDREIENGPKTINDMKLINAGKILENTKTLAESRSPVSEVPGGVIIMHVVVRPPMADKNNEKSQDAHEKSSCACTIL